MFRIGIGYDVHKLVAGRQLTLGGEVIPHEYGLLGHSDADVLLHAITDSLLGAAGLGDIGKHFPDTEPKYKDISSLKLLGDVYSLVHQRGYQVGNIDATIIAQKPKLQSYLDSMKVNIADVMCINTSQVNLKATTEEGLGFTGREEGISAQAICLIVDRKSNT